MSLTAREIDTRTGPPLWHALVGLGWMATLAGSSAAAAPGLERDAGARCLVIAHRGASGYRPEHTLAAYELAVEQGADYIEPDLVMTRDGVLITRHENELSQSTDVGSRPEFATRWTRRTVDGVEREGWFSEDFTFAEIRQLRAREPLPEIRTANRAFDGQLEIPTFDEVLQLTVARRRAGSAIGVYPEIKSPAHFRARGLDPEVALLAALDRHGLVGREAPVLVQSFDADSLRRLRRTSALRLVQLLGNGSSGLHSTDLDSAALGRIAAYAQGIGIPKRLMVAGDTRDTGPGSALVSRAHRAGLFVHVWTLRDEPLFVMPAFREDVSGMGSELRSLLATGIDGFFTDQPDIGRKACAAVRGARR